MNREQKREICDPRVSKIEEIASKSPCYFWEAALLNLGSGIFPRILSNDQLLLVLALMGVCFMLAFHFVSLGLRFLHLGTIDILCKIILCSCGPGGQAVLGLQHV